MIMILRPAGPNEISMCTIKGRRVLWIWKILSFMDMETIDLNGQGGSKLFVIV